MLLTLTTDAGVTGLGEGAPFPAFNGETQEDVLASIAASSLVGIALDDTAAIRAALGGASPSARCAIESAVVDARARARGISLHAYFGGSTTKLTTDITITTGTTEDAEREAREFAAFETLKIKVGGGGLSTATSRACSPSARRVPDATLMVDANGGLSRSRTRVALRTTSAARDVAWFEQPVRREIGTTSPNSSRERAYGSCSTSRSRPRTTLEKQRRPAPRR